MGRPFDLRGVTQKELKITCQGCCFLDNWQEKGKLFYQLTLFVPDYSFFVIRQLLKAKPVNPWTVTMDPITVQIPTEAIMNFPDVTSGTSCLISGQTYSVLERVAYSLISGLSDISDNDNTRRTA